MFNLCGSPISCKCEYNWINFFVSPVIKWIINRLSWCVSSRMLRMLLNKCGLRCKYLVNNDSMRVNKLFCETHNLSHSNTTIAKTWFAYVPICTLTYFTKLSSKPNVIKNWARQQFAKILIPYCNKFQI